MSTGCTQRARLWRLRPDDVNPRRVALGGGTVDDRFSVSSETCGENRLARERALNECNMIDGTPGLTHASDEKRERRDRRRRDDENGAPNAGRSPSGRGSGVDRIVQLRRNRVRRERLGESRRGGESIGRQFLKRS